MILCASSYVAVMCLVICCYHAPHHMLMSHALSYVAANNGMLLLFIAYVGMLCYHCAA